MLGCILMDMARIKLVNDGNTETEKNIKKVSKFVGRFLLKM